LRLRRRLVTGAALVLAFTAVAFPTAPPAYAATQTGAMTLATTAMPLVSFRLPFADGQTFKIVQGWNTRYSHNGRSAFAYDIKMPVGTPVEASASGRVAYVHKGETACGGPALRNFANYVTIEHADGSATQYGHLSRVDVAVGDMVDAGQPIGLSGRTGYTGCVAHLHFARQASGGPVTQSRPIYFEEYPGQEFRSGMFVTSSPSACVAVDPGLPTNTFCGTYFYGTPSRTATMVEADPLIDIDWRSGRPRGLDIDPHRSGVPELVVRWDGTFMFPTAGAFDFDITTSDGVRLSIDGDIVFDTWATPAATSEILVSRSLTAGVHDIVLEFHHRAGKAAIRLGWWAGDPALRVNIL